MDELFAKEERLGIIKTVGIQKSKEFEQMAVCPRKSSIISNSSVCSTLLIPSQSYNVNNFISKRRERNVNIRITIK